MDGNDSRTAYVSSIPPQAEERVVDRYEDGDKRQAEYWLDGERVGLREFHPTGELLHEYPFRNGVRHGTVYRWDLPGKLLSAEPYEDGVPHGTAREWSCHDGRLIGTYTLYRGTGFDIWRQEWSDGSVTVTEIHSLRDGRPHGFEWWLKPDQRSVREERHWLDGERHGVEWEWNLSGRLRRGSPRYWVRGRRVTKREYLRAAAGDAGLPP